MARRLNFMRAKKKLWGALRRKGVNLDSDGGVKKKMADDYIWTSF